MDYIYVVHEIGDGSIHLAFRKKLDAETYVRKIKEETQLECYEILALPLVEN